MHFVFNSIFACIFLFLFRTNPSGLLTFTSVDIVLHNLLTLFLLFSSSFDNNFILIGHSKQCVQSPRTGGALKTERCAQMLTHGACMGEASSYS